MVPAGAEHGSVAGELFGRIWSHVRAQDIGVVYAAETGFTIGRNPDTTRAPDVAFVRAERLPLRPPSGFFEGPPDLAVEVISPGDSFSSGVQDKVDQWLDAGAVSVWIVDPRRRRIDICQAGGQVVHYIDADTLADEPTLPEFKMVLSDLFDRRR